MKSRIPAAGAIVGSTMVSAVLALCVLGGVAGGVAAQVPGTAGQTTDLTAATVAPVSTAAVTPPETPSIESPFAAASAGDVLYGGSATTSTLSAINSASTATTTGTTASVGLQSGFGLLGGAAADQIPAAAQGLSPATVVAAPAKLPIVVAAPIVSKPAPTVLPAIAGTPRQMAYAVAVRAGLSAQQWSCLSSLWQQESKFQTTVRNSRSGAYGIPQALPASRMASAGADWRTNPVTQIRWGLSYISTRYGTACTAWSHWKRYRWY